MGLSKIGIYEASVPKYLGEMLDYSIIISHLIVSVVTRTVFIQDLNVARQYSRQQNLGLINRFLINVQELCG